MVSAKIGSGSRIDLLAPGEGEKTKKQEPGVIVHRHRSHAPLSCGSGKRPVLLCERQEGRKTPVSFPIPDMLRGAQSNHSGTKG